MLYFNVISFFLEMFLSFCSGVIFYFTDNWKQEKKQIANKEQLTMVVIYGSPPPPTTKNEKKSKMIKLFKKPLVY